MFIETGLIVTAVVIGVGIAIVTLVRCCLRRRDNQDNKYYRM